jgi:dienelactone hydrolase
MWEIGGDRAPAGAFILTPEWGPGNCAVLVLGGSEGGDQMARNTGAALVEAGFTVLGVPYHRPPGQDRSGPLASLPGAFANLPVERVGQAGDWLSSETGITRERTALYGFSKGAELALLAASLDGPYAAVVAIAPSDVVWEGWGPGIAPGTASSFAWKGRPLPFVPYEGFAREMARYARGERDARLANAHEQGLAMHPQRVAQARIEVELCPCPILLAAGGRDRAWPSAAMAAAMAERRKQAGLATELLVFPECGHVLCGRGNWRHPTSPTAAQDQRARTEIWARTLTFFAAHLGMAEPPA